MIEPLPVLAPLEAYQAQAGALLAGHRARDPAAIRIFRERHPRFLDPVVRWKPLPLSDDEIATARLDLDDARLALARGYSFLDWEALRTLVETVQGLDSPIRTFELAVEAVVTGDHEALDGLLRGDPSLIRARSTRVTCHDPPVHGATLLHYLAANGVEGYRQKSPTNAVAMAERLIDAGAEADALAGMYGAQCSTLSMLVSSTPPAEAGVQVPLVHALIDAGANVNGAGSGSWQSPLRTALVFGFTEAAEALVARGAKVDTLSLAAGLGWTAEARRMLPSAGPEDRHAALALAAQLGHVETVALLLDGGEDPDRFNPAGLHSHATPLHQAALAGHEGVVRLLVQRGARLDVRDRLWDGTPLGWATYAGRAEVANYLRSTGAV